MNFKKIFTYLTTLTDEAEDARKLRKENEAIFDADTSKGEILFKKEFLILDHLIGHHSIMFTGRYLNYKNLVLTDKYIYIVGISGIERFDFKQVQSLSMIDSTGGNKESILQVYHLMKLVVDNKKIYIYETYIPGRYSWGFASSKFLTMLKDDYSSILQVLKKFGYKENPSA